MVVVPGMIRYGVPSNVVVVAPTILVGANESGMLSTEGNMRNGVSFITVVATPALLNRLLASGISVGPRNSKVWCTIDDCQGSTYTRRSVSERDIAWSWDSDERCPSHEYGRSKQWWRYLTEHGYICWSENNNKWCIIDYSRWTCQFRWCILDWYTRGSRKCDKCHAVYKSHTSSRNR
jgi:hypothetical protein